MLFFSSCLFVYCYFFKKKLFILFVYFIFDIVCFALRSV